MLLWSYPIYVWPHIVIAFHFFSHTGSCIGECSFGLNETHSLECPLTQTCRQKTSDLIWKHLFFCPCSWVISHQIHDSTLAGALFQTEVFCCPVAFRAAKPAWLQDHHFTLPVSKIFPLPLTGSCFTIIHICANFFLFILLWVHWRSWLGALLFNFLSVQGSS